TARAARLLLPQLRCNGFGFDCELLMACRHHRLTVAEVPVHVRYDSSSSTTGMRAMSRMIRELLSIRRAWKAPASPPAHPTAPTARRMTTSPLGAQASL